MTENNGLHNHVVDASEADQIAELIEALSAYIEQYHGGWVRMSSYEDGVLKVEMGGACEGCQLSQTTVQGWIGGTVRQFFPQVKQVQAIPT
jgi:Fe-S cluster biogenesis protein NfuA